MSRRVGFVLGISGLVVLVALGGATRSPAASRSASLPPPSLRPSPAWLSVTTGSSNVSRLAPSVWAITARSNLAALAPFNNFDNLRHLSRSAVYLWGDDVRTRTPRREPSNALSGRYVCPTSVLIAPGKGSLLRTSNSVCAGLRFTGGTWTCASTTRPSTRASSNYAPRSKS
jgi:hypothetical protein